MEIKEIMTRKEAAEYIGVSLSKFAQFQNEINQIRIGKNVRFRKSEIDKYLISKEVKYE